jgi:Na+/melibiose symporter-like transporter
VKTGRRFTGMVFATIGFALKSGLALGSASFLWIMAWFFNYDTKLPCRRCDPRLPRLRRHRVGICVRHLHRVAHRLSTQQTYDHCNGRRTRRRRQKAATA